MWPQCGHGVPYSDTEDCCRKETTLFHARHAIGLYGSYTDKADGSWDRMAEEMMLSFSGSDHPIFRASSASERGELRSKGGGKKSIHFNGSHENIELLLRTLISANQLSIY